MQQCWVEEDSITFLQRQLNMALVEVSLKFWLVESKVTVLILLRVWQVQSWPTFDWHINVSNSALERQ